MGSRGSPVTVRITRAVSPKPRSRHYDHADYPNKLQVNGDSGNNRSSSLELPGIPRRSQSAKCRNTPTSGKARSSLQVPGRSGRQSVKGSHSEDSSQSRSRSYSPLPCGSPVFEKVLCDMLSDTELDSGKDDSDDGAIVKNVRTSAGKVKSKSPHMTMKRGNQRSPSPRLYNVRK